MSVQQMEFPETFERLAKEYGFNDDKEVYTNGSDLIPIFRVKQWIEHDNKLRAIETDTAYECGKAVLGKVRAEIEAQKVEEEPHLCDYRHYRNEGIDIALEVIDKYREEH